MREKWALVLAGGEGKRLEPLTRLIHRDERPKQFATIVGPETLLGSTLRRSAELIRPDRTLIVLTSKHRHFCEDLLNTQGGPRALVQPEPRGTAAAICWGMAEIAHADPDAIVGLIPSDHFYSREHALLRSMSQAYEEADRTGQVLILGATPEGPETSYGWIDLAESCENASAAVSALWEKPDAKTAQSLYERGCLWNTFILVGAVSAFARLVHDTRPDLELFFRAQEEGLTVEDVFRRIEPVDFSHQVIVPSGSKLRTVCLGDVGWSDLGEPDRALSIMTEYGTPEQKELASSWLLESSPGGP